MQDLNYFYLVSNLYQEVGYFAKRNKAILDDNILFGSLGMSDEIDFYSLDRKTSNIGNINLTGQYLNIIIALDQQISNYNRAVYSFFDMLGLLGGIFGLIHSVGFVLVRFVSSKQFYSFIVANLTNTKSAIVQSQTNGI